MKTLFFTALATTISLGAFSQDTLFTRSGQVILGKVYEINQTDIKYKKPSNPDGPLYTVSKDDIAVIEFKNGSKEVFQGGNQVADNTYSNNNAASAQTPTSSTQVNNNYYGNPVPRPSVNVVLGAGMPVWGGGWAYRPYAYYRPYYGGWYGWHGHRHHCRW